MSGDLLVTESSGLLTARNGDLLLAQEGLRRSAIRSHLSDQGSRWDATDVRRLSEQRDHPIRTIIANRSFEIHFQPIVDLTSGRAVGAEALARFKQEPIRPPDSWFAEAASVGLGVELELITLEMALQQFHRLPSNLYLSVNASVETILSGQLWARLADVPAERIVLELTEHTPIVDYPAFETGIRELRSQGVRLAVDDAGAGFSSFRHILDLRPDVIKLDIGLIRGIDRDPARQALGRALLGFVSETRDSTIVAEGIETAGELETLRALGCPTGQGFLLGRPGRLSRDRGVGLRSVVPAVGEHGNPLSA